VKQREPVLSAQLFDKYFLLTSFVIYEQLKDFIPILFKVISGLSSLAQAGK
jgi:hypothetical protein